MKDMSMNGLEVPQLIGVRIEGVSDIDTVLSDVAEKLKARGLKVAGLVQTRSWDSGDCGCKNMHLLDLNTGEPHLISEQRGPGARGCHLDWEALATLAQWLEQHVSEQTDILIINRFGRSECEGRGFRGVIEKAMLLGIPVIVAFREQYEDGWEAFHDGLARSSAPSVSAILDASEVKEIA